MKRPPGALLAPHVSPPDLLPPDLLPSGASLLGFLLLGLLLLSVTLGALALHVPGAGSVGSLALTNWFVALLGVATLVYFGAVWLVRRAALPGWAVWFVLAVAFVMRAALLPAPPFLSSDIYRYVWDGRVQAAGVNPYRYVPADPALAGLRDAAVYPRINRATYARTIYPPAAQAVFAAVDWVGASVTGMKLAMLGFEAVAILCAWRLLALAGLPPERILIYAWNPCALWAFACDGHVDAIAVGCLALALLCRARRRDGLAGALLAAGTLVKFLPVVAAPAFLRGGRFWRPVLAGAAVVALLYAPYLSVGRDVLGFLPSYGDEEGMADGTGFWLLAGLARLLPLPPAARTVYELCAAAGFALLAFRIARAGPPAGGGSPIVTLCRDTAILAGYAVVVLSPHYPWYFPFLALPSVVAPLPAVVWLSAAPVLLYLDPFHERFVWRALLYGPAILLAVLAYRRDRPLRSAAIAS